MYATRSLVSAPTLKILAVTIRVFLESKYFRKIYTRYKIMAANIRKLLATKSLTTLRGVLNEVNVAGRELEAGFRLHLDRKSSQVSLVARTSALPIPSSSSSQTISKFIQTFPLHDCQEGVEAVSVSTDTSMLYFKLSPVSFTHEVLTSTIRRSQGPHKWSSNALFEQERRNILVEFSSPNIAKPFHVGHLRSTILGNFVANIQEEVGHDVVRLNYLGDWGTQFGLLLAGLRKRGLSMEEVRNSKDPVALLLEVYIEANKLSAENEDFASEARQAFTKLEEGDQQSLQDWKICRDMSVESLEVAYKRLGIKFDHYDGESMYGGQSSAQVMESLENADLLQIDDIGRRVVEVDTGNVTIVKSDGSTLYITRDLAAAMDRQDRFQFDRMYYVVDNDQQPHFKNVFQILSKLGHTWSEQCHHVRFGKILGMSTRKGSMVTVEELLREAKAVMVEGQQKSKNTRVEGLEGDATADIMAVSALISLDLSKKRVKDYKFSWERALASSNKLQYSHARLFSLLDACTPLLPPLDDGHIATETLTEPEGLELAFQIARWDEILSMSATTLEPQHIVTYLFNLVSSSSKALGTLQVDTLQWTISPQ